MGRRRKGRPIDGILVMDKPAGMSSNGALQAAKRAFYAAKAGHTGSLDPLATGVLPLCFGEATKFSRFLLDADKTYISTFALGRITTTGDAEGEVLSWSDASAVTLAQVEQGLESFRGSITQIPSMYSAIKHEGTPLYRLAREGKEVERKSRVVTVHSLELLSFEPGEQASLTLRVHCSKGTYIRSIAEDLGQLLGCGAHVTALRRVASGPFDLAQSVTLERLDALAEARCFDQLNGLLLPVDAALTALPVVTVPEASEYYLRQGQPVMVADLPLTGQVRLMTERGEFFGIGEPGDDGRLLPRRLVNSKPAVVRDSR